MCVEAYGQSRLCLSVVQEYSNVLGLGHGVGREPKAAIGFELLDSLHQADIAFRDDFTDWQAVAAIAHRDLGDEAKMARYELVRGLTIIMQAIARAMRMKLI